AMGGLTYRVAGKLGVADDPELGLARHLADSIRDIAGLGVEVGAELLLFGFQPRHPLGHAIGQVLRFLIRRLGAREGFPDTTGAVGKKFPRCRTRIMHEDPYEYGEVDDVEKKRQPRAAARRLAGAAFGAPSGRGREQDGAAQLDQAGQPDQPDQSDFGAQGALYDDHATLHGLIVRRLLSALRGAVQRTAQNPPRELHGENPAELLEFALACAQFVFNSGSDAIQGFVGLGLGLAPLGLAQGQRLAPQLDQLAVALLASSFLLFEQLLRARAQVLELVLAVAEQLEERAEKKSIENKPENKE